MKRFLVGFFLMGLTLIFVSTCLRTFAQELPRKGMLGVSAQPVDETKAKEQNAKAGEGLLVMAVSPASTFEQIGVKVGDIILSINQKPTNTPAELIAAAQSLNEASPIEVDLISNGQKTTKKGFAKGKPKEVSENADVIYDQTEMSLGRLRTITFKPKNKTGKLPAVFYIQGLPCQSQELPNAKDPRRQAFEDWVKAGFVVSALSVRISAIA